MTFLTPIPALIAAAITVPALLALYLLKLRRRPVRVSSTLLWTARPSDLQVNVPLRWLKPSWLLFLQLLILACFLIALARPALDLQGPPARRLILVIDRTASMSAVEDGGATRLDRAKDAAARWIDRMGSGDSEACIVELGLEPRAVTGFMRDRGSLKAAVRAISPTDQPGSLAAALRLAAALLTPEDAEQPEAPRTAEPGGLVVLFSDGDFRETEPLAVSGADVRFERAGPPQADPRDNLGIVAVAARRDYEDPAAVRVFARLQNAGPNPVATGVVLRLDGEVLQRRAVTVPGAEPSAQPDAHPGQASLTMEARTQGGALLELAVEREDQLRADNAAAIVLAPSARPRIVLVIPDRPADAEPSREGPEWLLADPLRELRARSFRIMSASAYEQAAASGSVGADLLVFDRVRPSRTPAAPSLSFGAGLPLPGAELAEGSRAGTRVLSWDRAHPTLRHVSLDAVDIARAGRFRDPPDDPPSDAPELEELARGRDGPLIIALRDGPVRRLVVAFEASQSTWPLDFGFPIFLADAADYLTLRGEDQIAGGGATYTTAQPAELAVPAGVREAVLRGPIDIPLRLQAGDGPAGAARRIGLGVMERAGVYRLEGAAGADVEALLAVNLADEHESAIGTRDAIQVGGTAAQAGEGDSGPREIWHWFVTAALVLLAIEWLLHAWMMRV